jgi:hypothetical protein
VEESVLRSHAEVTDRQETHFLQHEFPRQFELNGRMTQEVLEGQRRDLHDVTDIETIDPFTLVKVPEDVFHI